MNTNDSVPLSMPPSSTGSYSSSGTTQNYLVFANDSLFEATIGALIPMTDAQVASWTTAAGLSSLWGAYVAAGTPDSLQAVNSREFAAVLNTHHIVRLGNWIVRVDHENNAGGRGLVFALHTSLATPTNMNDMVNINPSNTNIHIFSNNDEVATYLFMNPTAAITGTLDIHRDAIDNYVMPPFYDWNAIGQYFQQDQMLLGCSESGVGGVEHVRSDSHYYDDWRLRTLHHYGKWGIYFELRARSRTQKKEGALWVNFLFPDYHVMESEAHFKPRCRPAKHEVYDPTITGEDLHSYHRTWVPYSGTRVLNEICMYTGSTAGLGTVPHAIIKASSTGPWDGPGLILKPILKNCP
ncbi:MAG: hypothetical protein EAZ57_03650 [Cytophagales bacterium]|nr:MAG: hypothetical protein EAZ57_03650 [Cytophagales bacterium]